MLLFAPLIRAEATRQPGESLRTRPSASSRLDVDDAAAAFAAIVEAQPGGLGDAREHDVDRRRT